MIYTSLSNAQILQTVFEAPGVLCGLCDEGLCSLRWVWSPIRWVWGPLGCCLWSPEVGLWSTEKGLGSPEVGLEFPEMDGSKAP